MPTFRSDVLRESRERAGFTRSQLGKLAGVSRERIASWEAGFDQPSASFVPPLAQALGLRVLALLDVDPSAPTFAALRLAAGLTLQKLANLTALPYTRCQRVERGVVIPADAEIERIATALAVSVEELRAALVRTPRTPLRP